MGLLSCMGHLVSLQNTCGFKTFVTCRTFIRLFPGMHPHVCSKVIRLHKALATFLTLERPLPSVVASVYLQLRCRSETLAAVVARVRPLLRVRQIVSRQRARASEQFAAVGARVADAGVQFRHMEVQASLQRVRLSAVLAAEALLLGAAVTTQPVDSQGGVGLAAFPAIPAEERSLFCVSSVV